MRSFLAFALTTVLVLLVTVAAMVVGLGGAMALTTRDTSAPAAGVVAGFVADVLLAPLELARTQWPDARMLEYTYPALFANSAIWAILVAVIRTAWHGRRESVTA